MRLDRKNRLAATLVVGAVALATGCSSGSSGGVDKGSDPNCVTGDGILCAKDLTGFPFVAFVVSYSETCVGCVPGPGETTVTLTQPEPGRLCLSGAVAPAGLAGFNLEFARRNQAGTEILKAFDAAKLNITQVALTIDSPPSAGVALNLEMVRKLVCPDTDCSYPPAFVFPRLSAPGPVTAPFADFISEDPSVSLDPSVLDALLFQVGPGEYDFCIHDFKLLDAQDKEVLP
jgi:hypothetical protein